MPNQRTPEPPGRAQLKQSARSALARAIPAALLALAFACSPAHAAFTVYDNDSSTSPNSGYEQNGRLSTSGAGSNCTTRKTTPAVLTPGSTFRTTIHELDNRNTTAACVTFTLTPACTPATPLFSVFYDTAYNSSAPAQSYRGDAGGAATTATTASQLVTPGATLEWIVGSTAASTYCSRFHQKITSTVPLASDRPANDGVAAVGVVLHGGHGSWYVTGTSSYAYHWLRCDADGSDCSGLAGAYAADYTPTTADEGHTLVVEVTNTSGGQAGTSRSDPSNVVPANPPRPVQTLTVTGGHTLIPGTDLVSNSHSDDRVVPIALPFGVTIDGAVRTTLTASTNGTLQVVDDPALASSVYSNTCLPTAAMPAFFAPFWDDLTLGAADGDGLYTATTGVAPHRTFVIEWRGRIYATPQEPVDFEVVLHEDSETLSAIYGAPGNSGTGATIGYQAAPAPAYAAQLSCDTAGSVTSGTQLDVTPSRPVVAGTPQAGLALTGTDARYTAGIEPVLTHLQWQLCDAAGAGCSDVPGATGSSFTPGADAVGRSVRLASSATDAEGAAQTVSLPSAPVAPVPGEGGPSGGGPSGGGTTGGSPGSPRGAAAPLPVLSAVSLSARTLRGTRAVTLRFRSSQAGRATVVLQRKTTGRRAGRKCVKATHANSRGKACTRWVAARTVKAVARAGRNAVKLSARGLPRGSYHVVLSVTSAAKRTSRPRTLALALRR